MIVDMAGFERLRSSHPEGRIVLAAGSFDLLHAGHLDYLEWARSQGDLLVVIVNDDVTIKRAKGRYRPIASEQDRLRLIDAMKPVGYAMITHDIYDVAVEQAARKLRPDVIALYHDTWSEPRLRGLRAALPGVTVLTDERAKVDSSTDIMKRVVEAHRKEHAAG